MERRVLIGMLAGAGTLLFGTMIAGTMGWAGGDRVGSVASENTSTMQVPLLFTRSEESGAAASASYQRYCLRHANVVESSRELAKYFEIPAGDKSVRATRGVERVLVIKQQLEVPLGVAQHRVFKAKDRIKSVTGYDENVIRVDTSVWTLNGDYELSEEDRRIQKNLDRKVTLQLTYAPFKELLNQIATQAEINIIADPAGLYKVGVTLGTPITINCDNTRCQDALYQVLERLKLGAVIKFEVLQITGCPGPVTKPNELRILGLAPGRTRLTLVEESGRKRQVEVVVSGVDVSKGAAQQNPQIIYDVPTDQVLLIGTELQVTLAYLKLQQIDALSGSSGKSRQGRVGR